MTTKNISKPIALSHQPYYGTMRTGSGAESLAHRSRRSELKCSFALKLASTFPRLHFDVLGTTVLT